jgi:AraC-like DNA-binding protein
LEIRQNHPQKNIPIIQGLRLDLVGLEMHAALMGDENQHHYLPVDDRATSWGFYLTTAGRVLDPAPGHPHGTHPNMYLFDHTPVAADSLSERSPRESGRILPEFQVIYVTDTHGVFESDETGVVEFDGPTLLFLFPGVWHHYRPVGWSQKGLIARWLGFNGDIAYRLLELECISPGTAVRPAARPRHLAAAFDQLIDRIAGNPTADPILLSMHAMDLLASFIESAQAGTAKADVPKKAVESVETPSDDELVARMLDLIWTGSHRGLTMDQLCKTAGVPRRTMERRFHAARDHSLLTEVNLCRCRRAQHFLESTDLPVKNVCWLAGFSNPEQMRVTFLQYVGMTPNQFRLGCRRKMGG